MKKNKIIKKIIKNENKDVYDIEVENSHHYVLENGVISHNSGFIFAASIIVNMNKLKLKEDEEGNKTKEVAGIIAKIKCVKSRFSKPFEEIKVSIPFEQGLSKYSGLHEFMVNKGVLKKSGNRWSYTDKSGKEHVEYKKNFKPEFYEMLIDEWTEDKTVPLGIDFSDKELDYDPETGEII
jgi:hypothetical protein